MNLINLLIKTAEETKERVPMLFNTLDKDSTDNKEFLIHPILGLCYRDKAGKLIGTENISYSISDLLDQANSNRIYGLVPYQRERKSSNSAKRKGSENLLWFHMLGTHLDFFIRLVSNFFDYRYERIAGFMYGFLDKFIFLFDKDIEAMTILSNRKNNEYIIITFIHPKKNKIVGQFKFYFDKYGNRSKILHFDGWIKYKKTKIYELKYLFGDKYIKNDNALIYEKINIKNLLLKI